MSLSNSRDSDFSNSSDSSSENYEKQFFIYVMTKQPYLDYVSNRTKYLNFFEYNKMRVGDIILFYYQDRIQSGFFGTCEIESNGMKQSTKGIFKDNSLNNYFANITNRALSNSFISVDTIIKEINTDTIGFKNAAGFKKKWLNCSNSLTLLTSFGETIYGIIDNLLNKIELDKPVLKARVETELVRKIKKSSEKTITEEINNDKGDNSESSDDLSCSAVDSHEIIDMEHTTIPILMTPCDDYEFYSSNDKHFWKHYRSCKKCEKINNNDIDILNNDIEFINSSECKDIMKYVLYAYQNVEKYGSNNEYDPYRVIRVEKHDYYKGCLFILWG